MNSLTLWADAQQLRRDLIDQGARPARVMAAELDTLDCLYQSPDEIAATFHYIDSMRGLNPEAPVLVGCA